MLEDWVARLGAELGVDPAAVPVDRVLDVTRDAAHTIARPAGPVTTFLIGYAAARKGGRPEDLEEAFRAATAAIAAEGARLDATGPSAPAPEAPGPVAMSGVGADATDLAEDQAEAAAADETPGPVAAPRADS